MIRSGLELVETREIETLLSGNAARCSFTAAELVESGGRPVTLAGKPAAKRALLKALGLRLPLAAIGVGKDTSRKPSFTRVPAALRKTLGAGSISLSISHTDTLAVAFCLVYDRHRLVHRPAGRPERDGA